MIALQLLYFAWLLTFGRFLSGDEIAYKAAGREWARSGTFIAPELRGFGAWQAPGHPSDELRRGFGPPIYTFTFGIFVKIFGFGPTAIVGFDALIHILLGWATWALARALGPELRYEAAMIAAAATLPLGTAGRPDELGALLAMFGSSLLLRHVTKTRALIAGGLFALAAGTSLVAAMILTVWPMRAFWQIRRTMLGPVFAFVAAAIIIFFLVMTPLFLIVPDGLAQFTKHARGSAGETYRYAFQNSLRYGKAHYLACCAALVIAFAHGLQSLQVRSWKRWAELWLPPLAALGFLLFILPVKYYYVWIVGPSLLAAAACAFAILPWRPAAKGAVAAAAVLFWCAAGARFAFMSLVRAGLPPDQRMAENVAVIQRLIPPRSGVMTYDFWPAFANSSYRIYSTEAEPPWSSVDYIVLTGNGSGAPGQPQTMRPEQLPYMQAHFSPIYDHLNRQPFHLGPIRTNSAWGYGPLILKRNDVRQ